MKKITKTTTPLIFRNPFCNASKTPKIPAAMYDKINNNTPLNGGVNIFDMMIVID
jgi:hypothetical protein